MPLAPGTPAPDFTLINQSRERVSRDDLLGQKSMIVFMPFPFTRVCTAEACSIRDDYSGLDEMDTRVVMITTHASATNAEWARQNGFDFDILADYWPHGSVSQAYDAFDETHGYARRVTYLLDETGVIREVVASENLGEARPHDTYGEILSGL